MASRKEGDQAAVIHEQRRRRSVPAGRLAEEALFRRIDERQQKVVDRFNPGKRPEKGEHTVARRTVTSASSENSSQNGHAAEPLPPACRAM